MSNPPSDPSLPAAQQLFLAGRLPESESICRHLLALDPNNAEALHLLGLIAGQSGQPDAAIDLLRRAVALRPADPRLHSNLAKLLADHNLLEESCNACLAALRLDPQYISALVNLGRARFLQRRFEDSITAFRRVVHFKQNDAKAHMDLANSLMSNRNFEEAIAVYRQVIALQPARADAHNNLGLCLDITRRYDEAIAAFHEALRLNPQLAPALQNLGNCLRDTARPGQAVAAFRAALDLQPADATLHSGLIFLLNYDPDTDPPAIHRQLEAWRTRHAAPLQNLIRPRPHDRNPNRPLRIGYVSADFRDHVVARNIYPLFRDRDRIRFQIFGYSNTANPDAITQKFQTLADTWRDITQLDDPSAADLIRADHIDILIDLSLHSIGNRLPLFARKPAPVQVTFAGYPASTGLPTIDWRLTDPHLDPQNHASTDAEQIYRLPDSFWCYDPDAMHWLPDGTPTPPPDIQPLPALKNNHITFGSLNNFAKVNDPVLHLWSRILAAIDNSRLLLMAPPGDSRRRVLDIFTQAGVQPHRIDFTTYQPRHSYLAQLSTIDLALDTFPYNGHTTSLDTLWMGVPVITLIGPTPVGRAGLSQLTNLGLAELAAETPDQYLQLAIAWAADLPRLALLRQSLRPRMLASPLTDAQRFTRNVETAYRQMWTAWCQNPN